MTDLEIVLSAFHEATNCHAHVWVAEAGRNPEVQATTLLSAVDGKPVWRPPPLLIDGFSGTLESPHGSVTVSRISGPRNAWLGVGPCAQQAAIENYSKFLIPVVTQQLQASLEVEHAANELAERYEEINLLYTITEILGRSVALEETAATILKEVSETVGARRGSILAHDRVTDTLQAIATLGVDSETVMPIAVADACSVSARVFREQSATIAEDGEQPCDAESVYRHGAMLSVPIMWTSPAGGSEPLGVVNLSDRRSGQPFSAGDQKLITAIATQIGTAIQNSRLVRASLDQQQLVQELALAHDLQMKLLPRVELVAPEAQVAARVVPAESVGGDFYNLFRLAQGCTGVMIGDVSSHGYRAALIMALAMSASAIHAESSADPEVTLTALLDTLRDELASTEMFISTFYGVVDPGKGLLKYVNAGHPHAYIVTGSGLVERLGAIDPPLGMIEGAPTAMTRSWSRGEDLLLLFTDGVSDATNRFGARMGERRVTDIVAAHRSETPLVIADRVFAELAEYTGDTPQRDDLALVVLRS